MIRRTRAGIIRQKECEIFFEIEEKSNASSLNFATPKIFRLTGVRNTFPNLLQLSNSTYLPCYNEQTELPATVAEEVLLVYKLFGITTILTFAKEVGAYTQ